MGKINDTISFDEGVELNLQNDAFKAWFNENIQPKITFCDGKNGTVQTCSTFDEFNRPSIWTFDNITITAVYLTQNENYNFDKFIINGGTII
jgi:hypothetical protein